MISPKWRPINGAKKIGGMSQTECSNSTTAFLRGKQKDWMIPAGEIPKTPSTASTSAANHVNVTDNDLQIAPGIPWTVENYTAMNNNDWSSLPFPPDYDRGRFPALRRRRRKSAFLDPLSSEFSVPQNTGSSTPTFPVTELEALSTPSKDVNNDFTNHLPSPSPSIGTPRTMAEPTNLTQDLADSAIGSPPSSTRFERLMAGHGSLEELEKHLQAASKPDTTQAPSTTTDPISDAGRVYVSGNIASPSSLPEHNHTTAGRSASHEQTFPTPTSLASKRASINAMEPRKRVQTMPNPSTEYLNPPRSTNRIIGIGAPGQHDVLQVEVAESWNFRQRVSQRIHDITRLSTRPGINVEKPRLGLLRDACEQNDLFYLCLHQLFCLEYLRQGKIFPLLHEVYRGGLSVVAYLLVSNDYLCPDAMAWFSTFPLPWHVLFPSRPGYNSAYQNVLSCLLKLANNWDLLHQKCERRGLPPLVDELIMHFDVRGFTFQQVIFRALLRDVWKGAPDSCFQYMEDAFLKNHEEVVRRSLRAQPDNDNYGYSQTVLNHFQRITLSHRHHTLQELNMNNSPPLPHAFTQPTADTNSQHNQTNIPSPSVRLANSKMPSMASTATGPQVLPLAVTTGPLNLQPIPRSDGNFVPLSRSSTSRHQSLPGNRIIPQNSALHQASPLMESMQDSMVQYPAAHFQQHHISREQQSPSDRPTSMVTIPGYEIPRRHPMQNVLPSNADQDSILLMQHPSQRQPTTQPGNSNLFYQLGAQLRPPRQHAESTHRGQAVNVPSTQFVRASTNLQASQQNSTVTALHQADVRDSNLMLWGPQADVAQNSHYFRYIKNIIMPSRGLDGQRRHVRWTFDIDRSTVDSLVKIRVPNLDGPPSVQILQPGAQFCRIRCVKVDNAIKLPNQNDWVVLDNVWPGSTAVILNGTAMDVRRKSHHGKDLPIDASTYIEEGTNEISTAIISLSEKSTQAFAIGVELIEVVEEQIIRQNLPVLSREAARQRIVDRSAALDPDIEIVRSETVVDVTDPFSATLVKIPMRGIHCRHNQCFDRDAFLETRRSKARNEPSVPDLFRCPICGSDARPQSLVIDGFLLQVREDLAKKDRLDAKAIILIEGGWEIKEEEPATGEQGDGSGRRRHPLMPSAVNNTKEVIAIDDD